MTDRQPAVAYSINQEYVNPSSPPVTLPSDSRLNFIQLNVHHSNGVVTMIKLNSVTEVPGKTNVQIYVDNGSNHFGGGQLMLTFSMEFEQLCKLRQVVTAMINEQGRRRGKMVVKPDEVDD